MTYRITARVPDELNKKIDEWYPKVGLTKSQLAGLAIQAGFDAILRAIAPVESVTPEKWAQITLELMKQEGSKLNLPDGTIVGGGNEAKKEDKVSTR
jgi:hypothetical protein